MQLPALDVPSQVRAVSPRVAAWLEAARSGVVARMKLLHAADMLNSSDSSGWTALHWCAARDHEAAIKWLLNTGALLDPQSSTGHTALHVAAHHGFAGPIAMLLEHGASPTLRSKTKLTALHHAAASCSVDTVRCLLSGGASLMLDTAAENRDQSTPLGIAARVSAMATGVSRSSGSRAVLKVLEGESKCLKKWFRAARVSDLPTMLEMIGDVPRLVDAVDGSGQTALVLSVRAGRPDCVKLLLGRDASPNRIDSAGSSLLHHVVAVAGLRHGMLRVLDMLWAAGAKAGSKDRTGTTAATALSRVLASRGAALQLSSSSSAVELRALESSLSRAQARFDRMSRWRICSWMIGKLVRWHARAIECAYAPGGRGFRECQLDFEDRRGKRRRT